MSETEAMTIDERRKYIHKMWGRYREANKKGKGELLDEIEAVVGMHRKAIIRLLNGRLCRKKRHRERGREYGVEVDDGLDYPCAERLQPNLIWMARHLSQHGDLEVGAETLAKQGKIRISILKRSLKRVGRSEAKLATQQPKRPQISTVRKRYPSVRWAMPLR